MSVLLYTIDEYVCIMVSFINMDCKNWKNGGKCSQPHNKNCKFDKMIPVVPTKVIKLHLLFG